MSQGWVYTEGLTHFEQTDTDRLIMAGHDSQGKLVVALQLSREPFNRERETRIDGAKHTGRIAAPG